MFKVVRKGDASLQYTILPQTDQFFGNAPLPQPPDTSEQITHKISFPAKIIGLFFCTIVILPALFAWIPLESGFFNPVKLKQVEHEDVTKLNNNQLTTTTNSMDIKLPEIFTTNIALEDNQLSVVQTTDNPLVPKILETSPDVDNNVPEIMDTITEYTSPENKLMLTEISIGSPPPGDLKSLENSEAAVTILPSTTIDTLSSSTSSNPRTTVLNDLITNAMSSTIIFKKEKISHGTESRENDTIPEMYMQAGIASYKKGNITTSVLADGLSLEGLIFKTPEGTIKPWSKKCAFSDSVLYARLKRYCETGGRFFAFGLSLGATLTLMCSLLAIAKFKITPVRLANVEEAPLIEKNDEEQGDRSKLLEPETKLIDEKE